MSENNSKFDFAFLDKISGGDKNFIREMVSTFKEMTPEFIENSRRFLSDQNYEALSREAHRFIPGISFLGIKYLEKDMVLIEEYAKKKTNLDDLQGLVESAITKIDEIIGIFNKELDLK